PRAPQGGLMSYDINAAGKWFNYTSNMHRFFIELGVYPPDFNGLTRYEVADRIDRALEFINANQMETLRTEYDSENGWGSVPSAVKFLEEVRDACRYEIPERVEVSW